jgi:hypothetical protein
MNPSGEGDPVMMKDNVRPKRIYRKRRRGFTGRAAETTFVVKKILAGSGPEKMRARVGLGLYTAGLGFCGLYGGLCSKIILGFGLMPEGFAQNPGPRRLGLLAYSGSGMGPTPP